MTDSREPACCWPRSTRTAASPTACSSSAWTHAQVVLRQLNASEADAQLYGRLAGAVIYAQNGMRADPSVLVRNRRSQSGLWGYAISGDLPIVLAQIGSAENIDLVRQLVQAHAWWRLKGLAVDLVIWNEERDIYRQRLQEQILGLIAGGVEAHVIDRPGGIFVRHVEQIAHEDRVLLQSVARAVFSDSRGTLAEQISRRPLRDRRVAPFVPLRAADRTGSPVTAAAAASATAGAETGTTTSAQPPLARLHSAPNWVCSTGWAASRPTVRSTSSRRAPASARPRRGST
jgi:cellobiose phosphorylase